MMFCFHRCVKKTINDFRLLSHGPLCGRATSVPAADMQVAWLGTHSSDVTDTYQPPCLHLPAKLTEYQLDSGHCCGLCERSVLLQLPRHKEAPQPLAGRATVQPWWLSHSRLVSRLKGSIRPNGPAVATSRACGY